ncbi:MAG: prolyl oligopeptidase family serine peptidase [Planctomycetes bacterium]|nr:prolyl oligopeptidase family serine peptidase [Planctomycetota bacterium]
MMRLISNAIIVFALLFSPTWAEAAPPTVPSEVLVVPAVSLGGRNPLPIDPIAASLASPEWQAPKVGDKLTISGGPTRIWTASPVKDGTLAIPPGGFAYMPVKSDAARVVVLHATGNGMVYVNGEPRVGDIYGNGYVRLPVALREGVNDFLFAAGRGPAKVAFLEPKAAAELDGGDATLPDLRVGVLADTVAALPVRNCTTEIAADLVLEATIGDQKPTTTDVPSLLPASVRKVGFRLVGTAPEAAGPMPLRIRLLRKGKPEPLDTLELKLQVVKPEATQRRTFISDIDGSVQYYSLVPAKPTTDGKKPGLVLTLHGASVEAAGQAACYPPKPGMHIVAATNRRPFGFDWEDWGRLDALEVLSHASRDLGTDPRRTYLTGHSMGGHGTWHIGVTFPDRFAAIAPSAGWVSMWSYAGMKKDPNSTPERELVLRASGPSDTLALVRNLVSTGVYVLHGDQDDNVPVDQARTMRRELAEFHSNFVYREQPGAGHWWGNACVDWPPIFEFFANHELPERAAVKRVEFRTANPRVSADCHWLRIEAQLKAFLISKAEFTCDAEKRSFRGTTENIARLSLDLTPFTPGKPVSVVIDGQTVEDIAWPKGEARVWLVRDGDKWAAIPKPSADMKGPHRNGAFKDVFRNRVVFVYATKGTPAENAWALAKARYDAEVFWYRGNGSIDVIADTAFDPKAEPNRNVVLYGRAGMNAAWKPLLETSPVQVTSGAVKIEERVTKGDSLGVLLVRPRPGSDTAMVGAVAGTGMLGLRATERLPYFASGIGYPDWTVFDARGVVGAGYFGNDWKSANGESAWRKE